MNTLIAVEIRALICLIIMTFFASICRKPRLPSTSQLVQYTFATYNEHMSQHNRRAIFARVMDFSFESLQAKENSFLFDEKFCSKELLEILHEKVDISALLELKWTDFEDRKLFLCSISCILIFQRQNICGTLVDEKSLLFMFDQESLRKQSLQKLDKGGEIAYRLANFPFLLVFSLSVLEYLNEKEECFEYKLWLARALFLNQRLLENPVFELCEQLSALCTALLQQKTDCASLLIEICIIRNYYGHDDEFEALLRQAREVMKFEYKLTGKLGKRTKFQTFDITQLTLDIGASDDKAQDNVETIAAPENIELNDDLLLEKVELTSESISSVSRNLNSLEQCLLIIDCQHFLRTHPKDDMSLEQAAPIVDCLLKTPNNWMIYTTSLFLRSKLEFGKLRKVERATLQIQALVDQIKIEEPSAQERLAFIFQLFTPLRWELEKEMAVMFKSLGAFKTSLEIFERLEMWDDVIACYIQLGQKEKAEKLILLQMEKEITPNLLCILGDLRSDKSLYEEAWELSNQRYSRAQRSLGYFYFNAQDIPMCISSLEKALKLNPLFENCWFLKGICEMYNDSLDDSLDSFTHVLSINHENIEAWNNLASVLIKKGRKEDAFRAFKEAAKRQYDNLKIWDNFLTVAIAIGEIADSIKAINRIFDISSSYDAKALNIVIEMILETKNDFYLMKMDEFIEKLAENRNDCESIKICAKWAFSQNRNEKGIELYKRLYRICLSTPFHQSEPAFLELAENILILCKKFVENPNDNGVYQSKLILCNVLEKTRDVFGSHKVFLELESFLKSLE